MKRERKYMKEYTFLSSIPRNKRKLNKKEKEEKRGEKWAFQGQKEKKKDLVHYESEQGL